MKMRNLFRFKSLTVLTTTAFLVSTTLTYQTINCINPEGLRNYHVISPYENIDWNVYKQFKANFHSHTTQSDGGNYPKETIEDHYQKGYDVLAITDHNFTNTTWDRTDLDPDHYITSQRLKEINTGFGRSGRGMIGIPFTNEQSMTNHVNTYWANFSNDIDATVEGNIAMCQKLGGISHINHPGGAGRSFYEESEIQYYVDIYSRYSSCVGIEIFNRRYGNPESFRILWDSILSRTMPYRPVWGFSNDDTHYVTETGFNFNMLLMKENTLNNVRYCMENGTFFTVAIYNRVDMGMDYEIQYCFPIIDNIEVDQEENSIKIEARDCELIEWVVNNEVIATGNCIDLNDYQDKVNNYIRAQLKGKGGMTFTQPFGIIDRTDYTPGDINNDGSVDSVDYALFKRIILEIITFVIHKENVADLNLDRKIDSMDCSILKRHLIGKIKYLPYK